MIDSFWPLLSAGLIFTVPLTLITFVLGIVLGLSVALARLYGPAPLVMLVRFYVWLIRGTPLLVQLFLIFYGLPSAGIVLDAFTAAVIGFTLNIGAYSSEIIRATLAAIPKGQWEAAYSIGMNWPQVMWRVILPQAFSMSLPALINELILLVKASSLVSVVGIMELTRASQAQAATTFRPLEVYIAAACIYLAINLCLAVLGRYLEHRTAV
jgi:cystine transport system permease protein